MKNRLSLIALNAIIALLLATGMWTDCEARKKSLRMRSSSARKEKADSGKRMAEGAQQGRWVSRETDSLLFLSVVPRLRLSGYEKPLRAARETLFITNTAEIPLRAVRLEITYLTPDGQMIHCREVELEGQVPPGETRRRDFRSWDLQKSFYYADGQAPSGRNADRTAPYDVVLRILAVGL